MFKLLQENIIWSIIGITLVMIVNYISSCAIETNISEDKANVEIVNLYTKKGYIQRVKKVNGYEKIVWTKVNESVIMGSNSQ